MNRSAELQVGAARRAPNAPTWRSALQACGSWSRCGRGIERDGTDDQTLRGRLNRDRLGNSAEAQPDKAWARRCNSSRNAWMSGLSLPGQSAARTTGLNPSRGMARTLDARLFLGMATDSPMP